MKTKKPDADTFEVTLTLTLKASDLGSEGAIEIHGGQQEILDPVTKILIRERLLAALAHAAPLAAVLVGEAKAQDFSGLRTFESRWSATSA